MLQWSGVGLIVMISRLLCWCCWRGAKLKQILHLRSLLIASAATSCVRCVFESCLLLLCC